MFLSLSFCLCRPWAIWLKTQVSCFLQGNAQDFVGFFGCLAVIFSVVKVARDAYNAVVKQVPIVITQAEFRLTMQISNLKTEISNLKTEMSDSEGRILAAIAASK